MAVLAFVWFLVTALNSGNNGGAGPGHARLAAGLQGGSSAAAAHQPASELQRCTAAAAEIAQPMNRAAASVSQWEVHVDAMNKLVVGAITYPQASAFWNQTRAGAQHRIEAFDRSASQLQRRGVDCPAPTMLSTQSSPQLRSCARQVAADMRVLHAAGVAIGTWRQHVHAMEMLRMGKMSPAKAERMWLAMWQRGQHEVHAYRVDARSARQIHGCVSPTPRPTPTPSPSSSPSS